ncbi:hypothetical protein [Haliangium ochraceum]|uniref:hypothetical protein n=1 Tax=Haliangium ochraceum TaxID=80816 RepID=UPI00126A6268|nr:hypothetical protein [Haliangium ochraceum]
MSIAIAEPADTVSVPIIAGHPLAVRRKVLPAQVAEPAQEIPSETQQLLLSNRGGGSEIIELSKSSMQARQMKKRIEQVDRLIQT